MSGPEFVSPTAMAGLRLIARQTDCNIAAALELVVAEFTPKGEPIPSHGDRQATVVEPT